ncbi:TonB-dependent receptor [Sphingomonas dokdonensis]|uniref:Colicin I receptor n=1 Tax=Sphingomonas dokdonensis TaxID=344880 RepID=A0A245ZHQ9_9SPHN|nr:TonB-dependent receptor [Sphingomonas dokdonensis]OWK29281.1 colicin I receptor precursor [Sphingomonas dokdonensis]
MRKSYLLAASAIVSVAAMPAYAQTGATTVAQDTAPTNGPGQEAPSSGASSAGAYGDIVITAQRQSQRLQDVPIAVSAFTAENLEKQQIVNPLALQQSLPNVTFTKGQFATNTFTIRGIGDLCVGVTCDSATGIALNEQPVGGRILEGEFYDIERIEVLRGPQGTLFGRNATSGVVNIITAKPDLSAIRAAGEFEYGNYDSKRVKGMINVPIGDTIGVRVAGYYLNRDGYIKNTFNNSRFDGRDMYSVRGTLSWEPSPDTRFDFIAQYSREDDDRSRLQKQLCDRDATGILGCLPTRRAFGTTNANSTLGGATESVQGLPIFLADASVALATSNPAYVPTFLATLAGTRPLLAPFGLGSIGSPGRAATPDAFANAVNPRDLRTVTADYTPTWKTEDQIYTLKGYHNFGDIAVSLTAGHTRSTLNATSDYNLLVSGQGASAPGFATLEAVGNPASPAYNPLFAGLRNALIPNGPQGGVCQSNGGPNGVGVYGGETIGCFQQSLDFDRSTSRTKAWVGEVHVDSSFDGMFNFLLGGIYTKATARDVDYFVNNIGLDYLSGLVGTISGAGAGRTTSSFLASPFFRSNSDKFTLNSFGIFGEAYFEFNDQLKLTLGARYNDDKKFVRARTTFANALLPIGTTDARPAFNSGPDFDATQPGAQPFAESRVHYSRVTGRAVLDYQITPDNLIYASYSRGYKSGGINPPLSPLFAVPTTFRPETVDSFEIGSKNTFGNGALRLNVTGFYYKYKDLQLTRIVARTSVNDNISANIYGVEAEAVISPTPALVINANVSYLKTEVAQDRLLTNPRDVSGGRADAVIIKDLAGAYNCAVLPTSGGAAAARGFVDASNALLGLNGSVPLLANGTYGAFSACKFLQAQQIATNAPVSVLLDGNPVNVRGNRLPNSPTYKWAVGAQYTFDIGEWTLVPRADLNYTGEQFGTIFNLNPIDRIEGYEVVNAQVQLNGPDDRFYVRAFVSNLTANNAITGLFVTDQSSGLFTNVFTVEPRRYGLAAGFKF